MDQTRPYARLDFNLGTPGLRPFFEADGAVKPNDFRSLTLQNPYVTASTWLDKSSVDYDFRLGVGGSLWRSAAGTGAPLACAGWPRDAHFDLLFDLAGLPATAGPVG